MSFDTDQNEEVVITDRERKIAWAGFKIGRLFAEASAEAKEYNLYEFSSDEIFSFIVAKAFPETAPKCNGCDNHDGHEVE